MMKDGTYRVRLDGDGTPVLSENIKMSTGYWVADESGVSIHGKLNRRALMDSLSLMDISSNDVVGIWKNDEISYIDRAYHVEDKTEALELAKANNQIAIWDCEKSEAIHIQYA